MRPERLSWEEQDSAAFLEYGECFVPERELQTGLFCDLIPEPEAAALVVE